MVAPSYKNHLNRRRGISTIIGGIIFVVLLSAGFSSFFVAMDVQTDAVNAQKAVSSLLIDKAKEEFSIAASVDTLDANRLGIQLKNQGPNPVQVEDIWVITNSGNFPATKYLIDYQDSLIPAGYGSNILTNTPLFMAVDDYEIKVVSTLGTIKKVDLTVGASNNMQAELIAIPPDVKVGQNVTMIMHVENIGYSRLLNVIPFNDVTLDNYPSVTPPFASPIPLAALPVDLDPGEGAFFEWEYVTTGSSGSTVKFESYATAQEEDTGFIMNSNIAIEKIELKEPDTSEIIVLNQDLLSKPEIFMVIPSPFGDDLQRGLWGVNIVNPTAVPMNVYKITISAINPRDEFIDHFFTQGDCNTVNITPTAFGSWVCNNHNQMTWYPGGPPAVIAPLSVMPFLVKAQAGDLASSADLETALIQTHVFTSSGEFGKGSYGSSMRAGGAPVVNVYLTDVWPGTTNDGDIIATMPGIIPGQIVTFNANIADFDTGSKKIEENPDATLIVNVPRGWGPVVITESTPFSSVVINDPGDGSFQIVATLDDEITFGAETLQFTATAPTVTSTQMYVMYMLANGETDAGWALGPLAEVVLQVVPP